MSSYFLIGVLISATNTIPNRRMTMIAGPTQKGASTSHHDQSILSVSFKPINRSPSRERKETPDLACTLFSLAMFQSS